MINVTIPPHLRPFFQLPNQCEADGNKRHCLVSAGNCLMFGTAGGGLYYSSNRGESWQAIANHLPPIYCVHIVDA